MDHLELIKLANAAAQGKRPYFFSQPDVDRLLSILLAVTQELAVTRERLDTVERVLERRELFERQEIDSFRPDADAARERGQWHIEYLARVLRVLQQEVETMQRSAGDVSSEDVARELAAG
ncbi:MAG: hypothetical protein IPG25_10395 [Proteobacteria bacterium]|nr:hypothetical protein [Pseudomonadota bacterium]